MREVEWSCSLGYVFTCFTCKVDKSTACTLSCFFDLAMTEELCWRVHIASLVECIFMKRSEWELLALDTFLSLNVLVLIFPSHVKYFTLFISHHFFRTWYCIGFHCPDFFQAVISPMLFCFLGNFLFLTLDGSQGSTLVFFKTEF